MLELEEINKKAKESTGADLERVKREAMEEARRSLLLEQPKASGSCIYRKEKIVVFVDVVDGVFYHRNNRARLFCERISIR